MTTNHPLVLTRLRPKDETRSESLLRRWRSRGSKGKANRPANEFFEPNFPSCPKSGARAAITQSNIPTTTRTALAARCHPAFWQNLLSSLFQFSLSTNEFFWVEMYALSQEVVSSLNWTSRLSSRCSKEQVAAFGWSDILMRCTASEEGGPGGFQ